jgi:hypothetical protein
MAALTSANVRLIRAWTEGTPVGKKRRVRHVEVYNGSFGGETNTMPASAFGLRVIEEVTSAVYGLKGYLMVPKSDGSVAFAMDSAGGSSAPADVALPTTPNGLYFIVKGY